MYKTPEGKEVFVLDCHTHFWDGSPANQRNVHGKQFIDWFYAYHSTHPCATAERHGHADGDT